jgi:uncharacterized protein YwgA
MHTDLVSHINTSLEISLPEAISWQQLRERLAQHITHLINTDFEKLVYYLYRIDVNENKMRMLLEKKEGEDAAGLIADLIIERQSEKLKSRQEFRGRDNAIDDNEKW